MTALLHPAYTGPYPGDIWLVLDDAHQGGLYIQSDRARFRSHAVALAASLGWITTVSTDGRTYGGVWRITQAGLAALTHREHLE